MRKRKPALVLFAIMTAAPLVAQVPRLELFGGYSYSNGNPEFTSDRLNLHGWNASVTANVNRWWGVVSDFSGHYGTKVTVVFPCLVPPCPEWPGTLNQHTFLFGPRFSLQRTKAMPFVHVLFGAERLSTRQVGAPAGLTFPRTGFAMASGGGMNYSFTPRLGWRVQADYLPTRQFGRTQSNLRLSTGIVLSFLK